MSKLKNIDIYVGTVGSAYVDKETALKNKQNAEVNIVDVKNIISKAQAIKLALETSVTNSRAAENGAQGILNRLNSVIEEYKSKDLSKYLQLVELRENLSANDTDGIYANGGNVITASTNSRNAVSQIEAINDIITAAEVLLEDNRKLALIRANEYDDAVNTFAQYIPDYETDPNEMSNNLENMLNERIDEVQDNLGIIEGTITAVNNTTEEVGNAIDAILAGENTDTPVDVDGNIYYWYAGQKLPIAEGISSTSSEFKITEDSVNSWHELEVIKTTVNDEIVSLLMASISSMSTLTTWYVIIPADLQFSPVMSDLTTADSRFTKVSTGFYTVDEKDYVCYKVNNDIPSIAEDESTLNIIFTSAIVETPEEETITGNYWYFGTQAPSQPYIKQADIVTDNESMGWRKIEGALSNYTSSNPYASNIAIPVDDNTCYLIVPAGTKMADGLGETTWGTSYDTIIINGIPYSVFKQDNVFEFNLSLYIDSSVVPGPTGEPEPTGETGTPEPTGEPVQPKNYYFYIGTTEPSTNTIITDEIAEGNDDKGWHFIGTSVGNYSAVSPLWAPAGDGILLNENYEDVDFYLALPGNQKVYDGLGGEVAYQSLGVINIDGVSYNIYKGVSSEFAFKIY